MSDLAILVKDQQSSARGSRTEPRGRRAPECVLALANPDRPEDGWKLVSSDHSAPAAPAPASDGWRVHPRSA
jgi:hypothetical protein